jgi:serine/threonine protein kinase
MSSSPEVIGQGSYGCVHGPSLTCNNKPKINYSNTVSKTIHKSDAAKEMREYKGISNADQDEDFYLGKPVLCDIQDIPRNTEAIKKCQIADSVLRNLANYKLIIMKDGGENLETYSKTVRTWPLTTESTKKCEQFLLETVRLFYGLTAFKEHDLIHHDLKPQNIVYNEKENRMNFIDFGIMQSKTKITDLLLKGKSYQYSIFHWSFPWDTLFLNKRNFVNIKSHRKAWLIDHYKRQVGNYPHINNFFYYSLDPYSVHPNYSDQVNHVFDDYDDFIANESGTFTHPQFVDKCLDAVDTYGLGMALLFWLHRAKQHLDQPLVIGLQIILGKMVSAKASNRLSAADALDWIERLFETTGLLRKHKKVILEHHVLNEGEQPKPKNQVIVKKKAKVDRYLADADPGSCPEGKERNPDTGRCVKACPEGKKRNAEFKCVKDKTVVPLVESDCPAGKERNPKTRRCVAICPRGKKRDAEFKCVKDKTVPLTESACPAGKERNPKTRRCINKCKSGYERNAEFKCVKTRKLRGEH